MPSCNWLWYDQCVLFVASFACHYYKVHAEENFMASPVGNEAVCWLARRQ